ncbi:SMC-Scp complex subunit ScpB [Candidatus Acidulodesulfobacterium sp. H_13]|uniref:SMC-Scp complex subunit ScpB n=1 Tax=Candidatus Acidulodesulfobacterium sp. H_13 TaxID=3395470 RepID=UPI003AF977C0
MSHSGLLNNYLRNAEEIIPAIEAVIFASGEPVSIERLLDVFNIDDDESIKKKEHANGDKVKIIKDKKRKENRTKKDIILKALEYIKKEFNEKNSRGIYLSINDGGISFKTKPEYFDAVSEYLKIKPIKFTGPQLETLSIVAYKQPITKGEIDTIRGVDSASIIRFLLEKNLIKVAGRKNIVGKPLIYKTSDYFLEVFNLGNLKDLPSVKEMEDVIKKNDGAQNAGDEHPADSDYDNNKDSDGRLF